MMNLKKLNKTKREGIKQKQKKVKKKKKKRLKKEILEKNNHIFSIFFCLDIFW